MRIINVDDERSYSRLSNSVEYPKASIMKSVTTVSPSLPLRVKRTMGRNIVTISYVKILLVTMLWDMDGAHKPPAVTAGVQRY